MNKLCGVVSSTQETHGIVFVKIDVEGFTLGVMSLGREWKVGESVNIYFKESDVMVAHKDSPKLSARNKFLSPVVLVVQDGVLARIEFQFGKHKIYSLISSEACRELEIKEKEEFIWFVKSSEIILERE